MDQTWDVIVVGAGVVGSATACHAAKAGLKTLLIEQFTLGHDRGSSCGGSRIIRKVYSQDHYARMMPECFQFWRQLEKETDTKLLRQNGLLTVEGGDTPSLKQYRDVMVKQGAPFTFYNSNDELRAQYPMFTFPPDSKALLDPSGSTLYANKCVRALQEMSKKHGATILENTRVEGIYPKWVTEVKTTRGSFSARHVALCPGPWVKSIMQKMGIDLPLKVAPGYQCYWRVKSEGMYSPDRTPIMLHDQTLPEGYQFIYSFPEDEYPGMIKLATRGEPLLKPVDPNDRNRNPENKREIIEQLREYARKTFPHIEDKPAIIEPCMYTLNPDHEYILDRHPRYKTVIMASVAEHGFKSAPVVGKMITEMIQGKPTSYDISHFSLNRFKNIKASRL